MPAAQEPSFKHKLLSLWLYSLRTCQLVTAGAARFGTPGSITWNFQAYPSLVIIITDSRLESTVPVCDGANSVYWAAGYRTPVK
jgi:hypothetical protein